MIDYPTFIQKFEQYPQKDALAYDLRFLYGMRKRVALVGNGPRCMMLKDGTAVVPTYFSDTLNIVDLNTANVQSVAMVKITETEYSVVRNTLMMRNIVSRTGSRVTDAIRVMHVWMP